MGDRGEIPFQKNQRRCFDGRGLYAVAVVLVE